MYNSSLNDKDITFNDLEKKYINVHVIMHVGL